MLLTVVSYAGTTAVQAADATWNNAAGSFAWNASDLNWSTGSWSNAAGNGAVFNGAGIGAITVDGGVSVNSLSFAANGYTLNGPGALSFVNGSSAVGTGRINVNAGVTAAINTAINSNVGLVKVGGGTLQLSAPLAVTGSGFGMAFASGGYTPRLVNDIIVGGLSGVSSGGWLQIMNSSVLPASTRVGISNGLFDIGSNYVTIAELNFNNAADLAGWNPWINASAASVIGTGTLRVTGDINVKGVSIGNNGANTIGTNFDIGGGTQVIRTTANGSFALNRALQFAGDISNGSLLKTFGYHENGVMGTPDGLGLYGNNSYTGSTVLNGGSTVVTGTNASGLLKIVGSAGAFGSTVTLQGASGSYLSAATIQAFAGGHFIIDNNAALAAQDTPTIDAAQNNNRIRDDAEVQLRAGSFTYRGLNNAAASESFGKLNVIADHNTINLAPMGTGTVTLTAGELALGPRATLQVASTTLGAASKLFVTGAMPAADATGILQRMVGSSSFLTYDATTGLTPLAAAAYASSFAAGAGANVAITAASAIASSMSVNAIKSTGSITTTIADGQTLGVASGMILNTSGTSTFSGGTVAYGSTPGVFFGGTTRINSAITGSAGLINASSTLTLAGDLSGLGGTISNTGAFATTTVLTNTFAGTLEARNGFLNIGTSQTLAGQGAILIGSPENDANLVATPASLSISGAGANAVIARDIIVDNGTQTAAGQEMRFGFISQLSPLSNSSGSQTLSGNLTVNSAFRLQGGGASTTSTGSTNFTGNITGNAPFIIVNGRANFSGNVANQGGFRIGEGGNTALVTFSGTTSGAVPLKMVGGNNTTISYAPGSLPTGTLTFADGYGVTAATLNPLANSTINNTINTSNSDINALVGAGVTANWNGSLNGSGALNKKGAGTLVLGHAANTLTGAVTVSAGSLYVQGTLPGSTFAVASGATLGGNGNLGGAVTVNAGGTLSAGMGGVGTLGSGSVTLSGTLLADLDANNHVWVSAADLLNVNGAFSITGGSLALSLANLTTAGIAGGTFLLARNDGADAISGVFASVSGLPDIGYAATINYAFSGADSLGRWGDGNDLAVVITGPLPVPEPSTYALFGAGLAVLGWLRRRRA